MSKRFIFQQNGERKKAKLDISISDHNFPLSQNVGASKESNQETWGDEQDDEILLMASQACEEAYNDTSLPDYSICMQPMRTSTQVLDPIPSTSFKKPKVSPSDIISTNLKDKCNRISSPLPGISSKVLPNVNNKIDLSDNFNDKIYKGQDTDYIYRQLLQLQEENTKLKSENGKLLEKCVTKEGESSILRTQLKTCQTAVDKVRMEKIQAQEKVQMEWTEKITAANNQMHDLRTQLDFKNLEIISIKEKCKMLESNKVKLTQVTVPNHDISSSQKLNSSYSAKSGPQRRVRLTTSSVQTDDKVHCMKLNKAYRTANSKLARILTLIVQPTAEQHPILEYNEKLQAQTNQNKCRVVSTFHRAPNTPMQRESIKDDRKININTVYEDLICLCESRNVEKCFNIFNTIHKVLKDVIGDLEQISSKLMTAFQKEMDERYIEATTRHIVVDQLDLLSGRCLYKEEQAILARRLTSILSVILQTYDCDLFNSFQGKLAKERKTTIFDNIVRICSLLDTTYCAQLYSGLLLSILYLLRILQENESCHKKIIEILKIIIVSRPMPFVSCHMVTLVRKLSSKDNFLTQFCPKTNIGNLKVDYDQGVLLYRKDSCYLQILLKQLECALKCIETQQLVAEAGAVTQQLILLQSNTVAKSRTEQKSRCDCQLILTQIIVYALRICAVMLRTLRDEHSCNSEPYRVLLPTCRSGIQVLYQSVLRDVEFSLQLSHNEGHLVEFCEVMREFQHNEAYGNMLTELSGTFQSSPDDMTSTFHKHAWLESFKTFSIAD